MFYDAVSVSQHQELRDFALSENAWVSTLEIYLDRFEDSRPKPMRQALISMINAFKTISDSGVKHSISTGVADLIIPTIITREPRTRQRAALSTLEWLVRRDAFSAVYLFKIVKEWLLTNGPLWITLLKSHCEKINIPLEIFSGGEANVNWESDDIQIYATQVFTLSLLIAAQNRDTASCAGLLLSLLCQKLKSSPIESGAVYVDRKGCPFWVMPVRHIALTFIDDLEITSSYIFYPLFKIDTSGFRAFLQTLPVQELESSNGAKGPIGELVLLFSALEIAKELGLAHEDSK